MFMSKSRQPAYRHDSLPGVHQACRASLIFCSISDLSLGITGSYHEYWVPSALGGSASVSAIATTSVSIVTCCHDKQSLLVLPNESGVVMPQWRVADVSVNQTRQLL